MAEGVVEEFQSILSFASGVLEVTCGSSKITGAFFCLIELLSSTCDACGCSRIYVCFGIKTNSSAAIFYADGKYL